MSGVFFFPRLNDELIERASLDNDSYDFSYKIDGVGEWLPLPFDKKRKKLDLSDVSDIWKISKDGLLIERTVQITYPESLYGPKGIAPYGSELGMCIVWTNAKLTQTGVILPYREKSRQGWICSFSKEFFPGQVDGDLTLDLQLYLKTPAEDLPENEEHLINSAGVLLGSLEKPVKLNFDSAYLEFPINEMEEPGGPLWRLVIHEWTDPRSDPFSEESFVLLLNTKHPDCPAPRSQKVSNPALLEEIMASAYSILFQAVHDFADGIAWSDTQSDSNLEKGSICHILNWFADQDPDESFNWGTPEGRMNSIKKITHANFTEAGFYD